MILRTVLLASLVAPLVAQTAQNVLVIVNRQSPVSRIIGEYYVLKRHVPLNNVCRIDNPLTELIARADYETKIAGPIAVFLRAKHLEDKILYIVTTAGVPLRILGTPGPNTDTASVDSELSLLYSETHGRRHPLPGGHPNPFYGREDRPFQHPDFPMYLVTRLAGFDFADVKGIIDRALLAQNRGKFVIDLKGFDDSPGNSWLREAAHDLPKDRVVFDDSRSVLYKQTDVIGYASWGSNDPDRKERHLGFAWLPGAIATEFVSTNARTFAQPPSTWNLGNWGDKSTWFDGQPQSLTSDLIHDGATGASGHVDEPLLQMTPRPNHLLPAYYHGRNLAESYYLSIPMLSWMNVVIGDPLCSLGKP